MRWWSYVVVDLAADLEPFLALGLFRTIFVFQQPYKRHIRTQISYWILVMIAFFVKLFTLG